MIAANNYQIDLNVNSFASYYDESLKDHVYTEIHFSVFTRNFAKQAETSRNVIMALPSPDPNNFVPSKDITYEMQLTWIMNNYDLISLQKAIAGSL